MTNLVLAAFLVVLVLLLGVAALLPRVARVRYGAALLASVGVLMALPLLLLDNGPVLLALPLGPPSHALHVGLDPLAAGLLALLFIAGLPAGLYAARTSLSGQCAVGVPICLAGLGLAVLAADGFTLALGISITGYGVAADLPPGRLRARLLLLVLLAAGGLLLAVVMLAPDGYAQFGSGHVSGVGDRPLQAAGFICAVVAAGLLASVVSPQLWPATAEARPSAPGLALLGGALAPIALGLLMRLTAQLADTAPPLWWALLPLGLGTIATLGSGWRAATAVELDAAVTALVHQLGGLIMIAFGVELLAAGADLPAATALALAAVALLLATMAIGAPLAILAAAALQTLGGSRRIDRLGGLVHAAPATVFALLAGLASVTTLPPSAAFAGQYLLLEAVLTAPRNAGIGAAVLVTVIVAVLAVAAVLGLSASVRLIGVACLGRPRTPRAAAAPATPPAIRAMLLSLAGAAGLLGLLPGVALQWFAAPAIEQLAGTGLGERAGLLHLGPGVDTAGYAPLALAALLALAGGVALWFVRPPASGAEVIPLWQDGNASTAPWMPFGDPLTQSVGGGFVPALPVSLDARWRKSGPPSDSGTAPGRADHWFVALCGLLKHSAASLCSRRYAPLALLVVFAIALTLLTIMGQA